MLGEPAAICAALARGRRRARAPTATPYARPRPAQPPAPGEPLKAGHVLQALAERLPRDAILLEETPCSRPELHARIPATAPLGFLSAMGMLGFALPAAIGLRMARPDRPVLTVVGDGSSLYQIQALWSAAAYDAGRAVHRPAQRRLRDHGPARRARRQRRARGPRWTRIDIAAMARAQGCEARRIETHDDLLAHARRRAADLQDRTSPLLLEVVVAQDDTFDP